MSLKRRRSSALVLAAALAAMAFPARAQTPRAVAQSAPATPQNVQHPFHHLRDCLRILDLTDAQTADIVAIFDAAKSQAAAIRATLRADRDALKADLSQNPPDPCVIGGDVLKLHADRETARAFFESVREQVLAVLTPEQKARLSGCLQAPRLMEPSSAAEAGPEE